MKPLLIIEISSDMSVADLIGISEIKDKYDVLTIICSRVGIKYKVINIK